MIQILIIDDHPLVADGIATMIRDLSHLQITGHYKTGKEALDFLHHQSPDIILLDLNLPDTNGIELCAQIRGKNKVSKIIALTSTNETGIITQILSKGGNGYLLKDMERNDLLAAIDTVLDNRVYLSKSAHEKVIEQFLSVNNALESIPKLTRREQQILQLFHEGYNVPEIAEKIFLSSLTIQTHKKNLMQKMKVNHTQQLLKVARELGLVK